MIVVRRRRLKRFPQYTSPAKKISIPTPRPALTASGEKPCISCWSANSGCGSRISWKIDCAVHRPITALIAIHVGASSQTWAPRRISQ